MSEIKPITLCAHHEVLPTDHPSVWECSYCGEEFVLKIHWDMEFLKYNELLRESQHWADLGHQYNIGGQLFYNKVRHLLKQEQDMKVYLAGGWFTPDQREAMDAIEKAFEGLDGLKPYSPRKEMLYEPGADISAKEILNANILEIESSKFVIASTVDKDMGTLFECGYAYSIGIPIVYYFPIRGKFNLMLSETAKAVIGGPMELVGYLTQVNRTKQILGVSYEGDIE